MENEKLMLDVEIPANTTATVYIPAKNSSSVFESDKMLSAIKARELMLVLRENLAVRRARVTKVFDMAIEHQTISTLGMRGAAFEVGRDSADGVGKINIHGQFHVGCAAGIASGGVGGCTQRGDAIRFGASPEIIHPI